MKHSLYFLALALFLFSSSCFKNPVTGRSSLNLVSESEMSQMATQQYQEFLNTHDVVQSGPQVTMVKTVGNRLAEAVKTYLAQRGESSLINGYNWEFNLVNSPEVNAWCMPGGKVVVYTGILPYTQTETGLAVVLGHEIAHAIARHGNERMSQELVTQLGGAALSVAINDRPEQTKNIFMGVYGAGSQVGVLLPFSRKHESEADKIGLIFMAIAGYDPNEAISFWERMAKAGGAGAPEFLSTHPGNETRINDIRGYIPDALKYYKKN